MDIKNVEDVYKLSPVQQALLFLAQQAPDSAVSFEQATWTIAELDVSNFVRAWQAVLDCHAILRTAFFWEDLNEPVQVVCRQVELPVEQLNWQGLESREQPRQLAAYLEADRRHGINLTRAPLMRLTLIRLSETNYQVIWSYHHILLDGWSVTLVLEQVQAYYAAFQEGRSFELPRPRPFRDYIAWLRHQNWQAVEAFWRQKLQGVFEATALPWDQAPGSMPNPFAVFDKQELRLSPEASKAAQNFARQYHITVNTLIQAIWATLLSRYSGESDIVFGLVVHGRPAELSGFESMVGLFINGLPIRIRIPATGTLLEWLQALQPELAEVRRYGYTPLAQIQGWLGIRRNKPMFDYLLVDQSYRFAALSPGYNDDDHRLFEMTGYPLTLYLNEGDALILQMAYDRQRFDDRAIAQMLHHLQTLLTGAIANPQQPLSEWHMLTPEESRHVLYELNPAATLDLCHTTIHQLFEAQAVQAPDAVAVVHGSQCLTYGELNCRANQLAHHLRTLGINPETRVAICLERSLEMIVSVLATLKAGGAYIPLDPAQPSERLAAKLRQDARTRVVLTTSRLLKEPSLYGVRAVYLDSEETMLVQYNHENLDMVIDPTNLAYVIYTSGSTGNPKGVMVTHAGLVNAFRAWEDTYALRSIAGAHLQLANFSFDVFAGDWVRALCSGSRLVLCPHEFLLAPEDLYDLMCRERIACAEFVPVVIRSLMQYLQETGQSLDFMRLLVVGSDKWYLREREELRRLCGPETRVISSYGLTEVTIDSSFCENLVIELSGAEPVPIGRSFPNTRMYILDPHLRPVPMGAWGELYLGGAGLARGYLNSPELTAERFVPSPFGDESGARLYRTGDAVRYLADGNIQLRGRLDHQVKIRGFRIELGEIETLLEQHPSVRTAVTRCLPSQDSSEEMHLVAYVVPEQGTAFSVDGLRTFLKEQLPAYMMPAAFMVLAALPLTPSGKVDRRALPIPEEFQRDLGAEFVPPETALEIQVAKIWSAILHMEQVGILDNFFDLGGDSLLATQVINQVNRAFQVRLSVRSLIEQPTVADLALLIEATLIEELETVTAS